MPSLSLAVGVITRIKEIVHSAAPAPPAASPADPRQVASRFQSPSLRHSLWQGGTTFAAFLALVAVLYGGLALGWWPVLVLALPAAGLVVRIFIIQHDCGHGAYFRSPWANQAVGFCCSLLTFAPYAHWRRQHAGHHGIWNNLDRRDRGADFYSSCVTVAEYRAMTARQRFRFALMRHPVVANFLIPPVLFLLVYRFPFDTPPGWKRERRGVYLTNLMLVLLYGGLGWLIGFWQVALVSLLVLVPASIIGVWLFSIQHRYEGALWLSETEWTHEAASLAGSSFLHLPPVLRWFTGNIGFHHVHHLAPRIPNYRLATCHESHPSFCKVPVMRLRDALASWRFMLWDEDTRRLVTIGHARQHYAGA
jgi:omega-6 fatty acid desaturase (delta-12 desaturase)